MGAHAQGIHAVKQDGASGGAVHVGQKVEHGGLAGAVGADETADLRAAHGEVEIIHRSKAAEIDAEVTHVKDGELIRITFRNECFAGQGNELTHWRCPPLLLFLLRPLP